MSFMTDMMMIRPNHRKVMKTKPNRLILRKPVASLEL